MESKNQTKGGCVVSFFAGLWQGLNFVRRLVLNLIFVGFGLLLLAFLFSGETARVDDGVALLLDLRGPLLEQLESDEGQRAVASLFGEELPQTRLRDVIETLERGAKDDRIRALVMDLGEMTGGGLSKLQELRQAIEGFKDSGKKIIALGDNYSQAQYYLAAQADEVWLHPMGGIILQGYGRFENYYKDALDRYGIDWHVFRVGAYKSAVEPYLANAMSEEVRTSSKRWLEVLWQSFVEDVAAGRNLDPSSVDAYAQEFVERLRAAGGNIANLALEAGLVDRLVDRDTMQTDLAEIVGKASDGSFRRIGYKSYLEAVGGGDFALPQLGSAVGVLIAQGDILYGNQDSGSISSESTIKRIRKAREDDSIKALVVRIDSGGGSSFASELIRQELELVRQAGKPVVISMSTMTASGGYWIATASDEIWANPTTLTGSIGIFSTFPTVENGLEKIGIHTEGLGTTPLSGFGRPDLGLPKAVGDTLQLMADQGYRQFIDLVANARDMTPEAVDDIAQGRVWIGLDAHEKGLVDHLGGLQEAIAAAAQRAGMGDDPTVRYLERELSLRDRLMIELLARGDSWLKPLAQTLLPQTPELRMLRSLSQKYRRLEHLQDPKGIYAFYPGFPN